MKKKLAIVGTVGLPARYAGFETLVENLVYYAEKNRGLVDELTVFCGARAYSKYPKYFGGAKLQYSRFKANEVESIAYDSVTAIRAAYTGHDYILLVGVSGAIVIPILKLFTSAKIITKVDGIEWRREKWNNVARSYLKLAEWLAIKFSDVVIADNRGISEYITQKFDVQTKTIAYGGDHATTGSNSEVQIEVDQPETFALGLCRIEPKNNIYVLLKAFEISGRNLVFVGNWNSSSYGQDLKADSTCKNIILVDPICDPNNLFVIRSKAEIYIHGHSAGGTNPALIEMMHFGFIIIAFECTLNRYATKSEAFHFSGSKDVVEVIERVHTNSLRNGYQLRAIAQKQYIWSTIGEKYFDLLD